MSGPRGRGRAAFVGIALAALFAACSGSGSTPPAAGTPTAPAASPIAGAQSLPATGAQSLPAASAAAASSDAGGPASSDASGEACAIVTKDAVSLAMGFPVGLVDGAGPICTFQTADSSHLLAITVYHSQADMSLMLQIKPGSDQVAGLGDDAYFAGGGQILFVRHGNDAIEILDSDLIGSAVGSAPRDAMITLARAALPKL